MSSDSVMPLVREVGWLPTVTSCPHSESTSYVLFISPALPGKRSCKGAVSKDAQLMRN